MAIDEAASPPVIASLRKAVEKSRESDRLPRQRALDALLHVADAWQILVRAEQSHIAKSIDHIAASLFSSSWTPVAVEVYMMNIPDRRNVTASADGDDRMMDPMDVDSESRGLAGESFSKSLAEALWLLAQAWNDFDGSPDDEGKDDAEKIRRVAVANFGEPQFRPAMVRARAQRLKEEGENGTSQGGLRPRRWWQV